MTSRHRFSVFENLVLSELRRYRLNCTKDEDYEKVKALFKQRLDKRKYQFGFAFNSFSIPDRNTLLIQAIQLKFGNKSNIVPVSSLFGRALTYDPQTTTFNWNSIFRIPEEVADEININQFHRKRIALKHPPNLAKRLIRAKLED